MKIYLAAPFFNEKELTHYKFAIRSLRAAGHEVYAPQEHEIENAWDLPNYDWAFEVYQADIEAIDNCDAVLILNFGMYSDSGTAWEAGYACASGKFTVQVLCGDENTTYSLMMINGCDRIVPLAKIGNFDSPGSMADLKKVIQK